MAVIRKHSEQKVKYCSGDTYKEVNEFLSTGEWEVISITPLNPTESCSYPTVLVVLGKLVFP